MAAKNDFELAKELVQQLGLELDVSALEDTPRLTDRGNAQWLFRLHGEDLHYCHPTKSFYWWNGSYWVRDTHGKVEWWARDVADQHFGQAEELEQHTADLKKQIEGENDVLKRERLGDACLKMENLAKAYDSWARKSESVERIHATVTLARSIPDIVVQPEEFDQDPWLLGCLNGTVDLRTGEFREPKRGDLITHVCPFEHDPDARLDLWDWFLERSQPDPQTLGFLARCTGYSITGLTTEEKLFLCYGPPNTGKSTFLQAINATLGGGTRRGYSTTANFDAFIQRDYNSSGHSEHIARLFGKRVVISIEVEEGKKLAEGLVKQITGGDMITASHKYQESFEFPPTFQLWLAANY